MKEKEEPTGQQPEAFPNVSYTVLAQEYQKAWEIIEENDRLIAEKDKRIAELEAALSRCSECNDLATSQEYAKTALNGKA